jgi:hypothetical protein
VSRSPRPYDTASGAAFALGVLTACSAASTPAFAPPSSAGLRAVTPIANEFRSLATTPFHAILAPGSKRTRGIYVSEFYTSSILGYPPNNRGNAPPTCSVGGVSYPNDIVTDGKGNLIEPDGGTRTIIYFGGPHMCGAVAATVEDPFGEPSDAAHVNGDALTQQIAIGNFYDNALKVSPGTYDGGSIALCGPRTGCTTDLTNPAMGEIAGVAMDRGDCWGSSTTVASVTALFYFKHCAGSGRIASGFANASYGGLDVDRDHNLVSISYKESPLYVYSGCNPHCRLIGGPFTLVGASLFGHLNDQSTEFFAADDEFGQIDVYKYTPTALTYEYSFSNGLTQSDDVEGVAVNPE